MTSFDPAVLLISPAVVFSAEELLKAAPRLTLDPTYNNPIIRRASKSLRAKLNSLFSRQREKAVSSAHRILSAHWAHDHTKLAKQDSKDIADRIYESIREEFDKLPTEVQESLVLAAMEGASKGLRDLSVSDEGMIESVNAVARDWARQRAAEMVGMRRNAEGELIPNPSAKWVISDTTREDLRDIISRAFEDETAIDDVAAEIKQAGAFSDARAANIARTEISQAQVSGNWETWKQMEVVAEVQWLVSSLDPCEICEDNGGEMRSFGEPFPSGDLMPLAHVNCRCILVGIEAEPQD